MGNADHRRNKEAPPPGRRQVLGLLGGAAAATVGGTALLTPEASAQIPTPCVRVPEQTLGPYFVDEGLLRSDIRPDANDGRLSEGIPLHLTFLVSGMDQDQGECSPLQNALIDLWNTDARGEYSAVRDPLYDNRGQLFLRGSQRLDDNGMARFITIFPGWYPSRTVHLHFLVRTQPESEEGLSFASQLYFDDEFTDFMYLEPPYAERSPRPVRNDNDRIYQRGGGHELMLQPERRRDGSLHATFELALLTP